MSWMYSIYSWTVTTEAWPTESLLAKLPTGVPPLKIHYETPIYKGYFPRGIPKQLFLGVHPSFQVWKDSWRSCNCNSSDRGNLQIMEISAFRLHFSRPVLRLRLCAGGWWNVHPLMIAPDCGLPDCGLLVVSGLHVTVPVLVTLV